MPTLSLSGEAPWKAGLRGARANLVPGLILQAFALAVVLGYSFHEPTRAHLDALASLREQTGLLFVFVSTGLFGGLLPQLYLKSLRETRHLYNGRQGVFLTLFWSCKGLEIAWWYGLMAQFIGEDNQLATIVVKTVIDQFVYCTLISIPITTLAYQWCDSGFATREMLADLRRPRWYARRVLPMLCANFGVWIPLVVIIYTLPTALQLPLQNIVLCFYTLLLARMPPRQNPQE